MPWNTVKGSTINDLMYNVFPKGLLSSHIHSIIVQDVLNGNISYHVCHLYTYLFRDFLCH